MNSGADIQTQGRLVILARPSTSTRIIVAELQRHFPNISIIYEAPDPTLSQLGSRLRRFGLTRGLGQLLFRVLSPILSMPQRTRREQLQRSFIVGGPCSAPSIDSIKSVNSAEARRLLRQIKPSVVVVNGTRIIGRKTLASAPLFLNMHAGITPQYRGVHGGYWAMANRDVANFGVTIHRVDCGVDTGEVICQARICPDAVDGFFTYPLVQLRAGLPLLIGAVKSAMDGSLKSSHVAAGAERQSRQWFHPTLLEYMRTGITKGVW